MAAFFAGLATGVLSGFGVGGGTLLLIYMTAFAGVPQTMALPAHIKNGFLEKTVLLPAILTGLAGTALAAWIATGLDVDILHRFFGYFLLYVGVSELFRKPAPSKGLNPPDDSGDKSGTPPK